MQGSIDADFDLVFNKTLSQKSGLGPRTGQRWPKFPEHAFFVTSPPEIPPTENKKHFFSILTTRLAESVDGLDSSLAQSPGEL